MVPAASRQQRARGVSRAPSERRGAAVPDSCAHQLPASPKAPAALLTPHGLLALPMPPRNPTVCAPPPLSPPPAPARPACYRPFDWLRSAPISRSPKAPGTLATSRGLPAPPPPPRHRSLPPHAAASAAAPRAPHHNTASKNEGVGKSPAPPSARGPLQLCFSNTPPFEKFSNSYLIVGAAVVRAF